MMMNRSRLKRATSLTWGGLRVVGSRPSQARSVYIASGSRHRKRQSQSSPQLASGNGIDTRLKGKLDSLAKESKDFESRIKQIQAYTAVLRRYIAEKDEALVKEQAAEKEKLVVDSRASEKELESLEKALEIDSETDINRGIKNSKVQTPQLSGSEDPLPVKLSGLGLFANPASSVSLPASILSRLGNSVASISSSHSQDQNWLKVIHSLQTFGGLQGLAVGDVDKLIQNIPLDQRSSNQIMPLIHQMMAEANIKPSKLTLDLTMAAYAHKGETDQVELFMKQMQTDGFTPDVYTYGHLIKSYAKNRDLKNASLKLHEMQSLNITPSLQIYTTILQTCIRVNDFDEAFRVFDLLKYMSLETQPDLRIYNSLLLAAAKQHNIEKVLDLLAEMTTRPLNPLEPNAETYNTLIFACARDERTHIQAWKYLIEMKEKGFDIDRKSINALLYLCGETGEVLLARAMFRQLCTNPMSYPDSFAFNCLLNSYSNYKPGIFSPVMASELGTKIRSSFFLNDHLASFSDPDASVSMPPFIPTTMLHSHVQVLAESKALFDFFTDFMPSMINAKVILTYLKVPFKLGYFKEFRSRYRDLTFFDKPEEADNRGILVEEPEEPEELENSDISTSDESAVAIDRSFRAIPRNWNTYDLAIKAAVAAGNMNFAQKVWMERGLYRRTPAFKQLPEKVRKSSDFAFAQSMVELHTKCGDIDQALKLIRSTIKLFHWKKYQVADLINKIEEMEDEQSRKELIHLLASYHRAEQTSSQYYHILDKHNPRPRTSADQP
ncbi:Ccm1p [Sugiyamaella lignohabitans]|uniref:Ccm1p n=1 Tax=Sugiyamaella lignohabitans TaxID=796027 RepID=A0A167F9S0_9ASCO|nr:Ccm1p [Sugiyamaella lignohabitans]ANB15005.1 Ccm1p [Sugiyamaella lignohabitans]